MSRPALDPQFFPFVEALAQLPPVSSRSLEELRAGWDVSVFGEPEPVANVRDLSIPVEGGAIGARLYLPDNPAALLVYYHGGGWVLGDLDSHDLPLRALANGARAAVLSVDYRLAPEHPFPTGLEDCYAALVWATRHQAELAPGAKSLVVAGDSAGGNLAAAVALAARDRAGPKIACQLLLYPVIDGRCDTRSFAERGDCAILTSEDMRWYWRTYVSDDGQRGDPLASPCLAQSHRDLPSAIVAIAGYDPLHDEGAAYADQLSAAGNDVTLLNYETLPHGFFNALRMVDAAGAAFREIVLSLDQAIARAAKTEASAAGS
jgi:acetyl esterase